MYQEKVVSNFIVSLLSEQTLTPGELYTLETVCADGFKTPNPMVSVVRDMIAGADVHLNDANFRSTVKSFIIGFIVNHDKELQETLRRAETVITIDRVQREIKEKADGLKNLVEKELERLRSSEEEDEDAETDNKKHTVICSDLVGGVFVTEHIDGVVRADATVTTEEWEKFKKFLSRKKNVKVIDLRVQ